MATAIKTRVYNDLITTLNQVRISGGYENDATAEGQAVRGNSPSNRNLLLIDNGDTYRDDSPHNCDDYDAAFTVICMCSCSDAANLQPYPTELQQLVAEVRRALNTDYTRGGNAINTIVGSDVPQESADEGVKCRSLSFTVHYRTNKDDPTSYGD